MTPRPRKAWTKTIEESGISVRLFERDGMIYRDVRLDGGRDKKSLGHGDRVLAEKQARALAQRIAELRFAGHTGPVTLGQLATLYERDRCPMHTMKRRRAIRGHVLLLEQHFTRGYVLDDLSQHALDTYVAARQSGALKSPRHRVPRVGVSAGTVRNELHTLEAMVRWGQGVRIGGKRLIVGNPLAGLIIPSEKNARRPIATEARYRALLAVADVVEPTGRFRCVLSLSRTTGRRINAICTLKVSDVLLSVDDMRRALSACGMDLAHADVWPNGAILWASAIDKLGFESITPLSRDARAALDAYLRERVAIGDAPLLPGREDPSQPIKKEIAYHWLRKAEKAAKLEHMERGGYHVFRRLFASERRHLSATDVAAAGGWRSLSVMRASYMHADAAGVLNAVELAPPRPTKGPLKSQRKA